jgi:hypothetical protein
MRELERGWVEVIIAFERHRCASSHGDAPTCEKPGSSCLKCVGDCD